jgi:hypothetical protein
MVVKIDKSTLPGGGAKVKFKLYPEVWLIGEYDEKEGLFIESDGSFYSEWVVHEWELLN